MIPNIVALFDGADNIFEGTAPDRVVASVFRPELHVFAVSKPKARVLLCAGGGYVRLMYDSEGVEIARWLNGLGYEVHLLIHRLPGQNGQPKDIALSDGVLALDYLKAQPELPLLIMGLSSGGHLAGVLACQAEAAGVLITYAPINANHRDYKFPAGKPDYPPVEKQDFYNDWAIGLGSEPHGVPKCPIFLAYALHDAIVPVEHALNFIKTARDLGLDLDAHIFGQAPHGFSLRERDGTQAAWPDLAAAWMERKLG
jgi:acetyl esterase/lipase